MNATKPMIKGLTRNRPVLAFFIRAPINLYSANRTLLAFSVISFIAFSIDIRRIAN